MDAGLNTTGARESADFADRLRKRDGEALALLLSSLGPAVHRYCSTVCEPAFVNEAVEVTFSDFLEKVDRHRIIDLRLESALMRSTRLTAAEAAQIDWDEEGAPAEGRHARFDCQLTPLFLAGSPSAPASVVALARMDGHVVACLRCQASVRRFEIAEEDFPRRAAKFPNGFLRSLISKFSPDHDEGGGAGGAKAGR